MSGVYKDIYKGNDKILKVIKNGEVIWKLNTFKYLNFKTERMTSPYSNLLYLPTNVMNEIINKKILKIVFENLGVINEKDIGTINTDQQYLNFKGTLGNFLDTSDWINIGTEIKIEYL